MLDLTREEKTVLVFVMACLVAGVGVDFLRKRYGVLEEAAIAGPAAELKKPGSTQAAPEGLPKKININTADINELMTLKGVGVKTAENIIEYRGRNGPFSSSEDLVRVKGIGEKKFEKIRDRIIAE
jgi:competence protein ComEA